MVPGAATALMLALATHSGSAAAQNARSHAAIDTIDSQTATHGESAAVDPIPPRTLVLGYVETTSRTLPGGQGYFTAGYLGASSLARDVDFGSVDPLVFHAAYGVFDNLTVSAGLGLIDYRIRRTSSRIRRESIFIPYMAPRFRLLGGERHSVAVGGYLGYRTAGGYEYRTTVLYGVSVVASRVMSERALVSVGVGAMGPAPVRGPGRYTGQADVPGDFGTIGTARDRATKTDAVFAVGGEFNFRSNAKLVGEFRLIDPRERGLFTTGVRFCGTTLNGEVGLAQWFGGAAETRPIIGIGYRF